MAERSGAKLAESIHKVEGVLILTALATQLNNLATKVSEVENQCTSLRKYIPPHERRTSRGNRHNRVEDTLQIILQKVNEQDRVINDKHENVKALNQMVGSHSRSIQLIRSLLSFAVPPLDSNDLLGLPGNARVNPNMQD
uniref:Uncharacterized protein n=1 Tax=Solanum tuberosum TaxID=4113 RepID=M1DK28_SOLTU